MKNKVFVAALVTVICCCMYQAFALAQGTGLSMLAVSSGTMEPAFDANTLEYSVTLPQDNGDGTITAIKTDDNVSVIINGVDQDNLALQLGQGEVRDVTVQVTDGDQKTSYVLHIHRQKSFTPGAFTLGSGTFTPADVTVSPDKDTIYMTDNAGSRVLAVDLSKGDLRYLSLPYKPQKVVYAGGMLLVTLVVPAINSDEVAVIDPETFTLTKLIDIAMDADGVAGDNNYIFAYFSNRIFVYSRDTGEMVSWAGMADLTDVQVNPSDGNLYCCQYGGVTSYKIVDGHISQFKQNKSYTGDLITIMPDGKNLVLDSGVVLSCSPDSGDDLQYKAKIQGSRTVDVDALNNELCVVLDRLVQVYDASSLAFQRVVPETQSMGYFMCSSGWWVTGESGANNLLAFREADAGAFLRSLKINGDEASELYPMRFAVDLGEVPNSMGSIDVEALPAYDSASVSGDIGSLPLVVGENRFSISVKDVQTNHTQTYDVTVTRRSSDPQPANAFVNLGFTPLDVAMDPDRPVEYMTAVNGKSLYRVDLGTGEITGKQFCLPAERMVVQNGKIYLTLLRSGHDYNGDPYHPDGYGAVAVINTASFRTEYIFDTNIDPYDIQADDTGIVYLAPGSGQHSILASYDGTTGRFISSCGRIFCESFLTRNPVSGKLYSIGQDGFEAFEVTDGAVSFSNEYFDLNAEDYKVSSPILASPDGKYVYTGTGSILTSVPAASGDLAGNGSIGEFTSICFDIGNNVFYSSQGKTMTGYDYDSRTVKYSYTSADDIENVSCDGSHVVALQEKSDGAYYLAILNTDGENADLSDIHVSAGTLIPAFDKDTTTYSLILGADTGSANISAVLSDSLVSVKIDGNTAQSKTVTVANGGSTKVTIVVTAKGGKLQKAYTLLVYRQPLDRSFAASFAFFSFNDRDKADHVMGDDGSVYLTGTNQSFVYRIDCDTGALSALPVPGIAGHLGYTDGMLLVTLEEPAFNKHAIGMIDTDSFTFTDSISVDKCYSGVRGDDSYLYAYTYDTLNVYSRSSGQKTCSLNLDVDDLQVNSTNGLVYVGEDDQIDSFRVVNGELQSVKAWIGWNSHFTILPDGKHLVQNSGIILTCSTNAADDLVMVSRLTNVTAAAADAETNEMYAVSDRTITVYDASSLAFKRVMSETATVKYIMCAGGNLVVAQNDVAGYPDLHWGHAGALLKSLKINGDAFTEFYPLHFTIDRGEVPHAMTSADISMQAAQANAVVSGVGKHQLTDGKNSFSVTVTDPSSGRSEVYMILFSRRASDPPATIYDGLKNIGFSFWDTALDPDRSVEYMTPYEGKSLYRVDLVSGAVTEKKFDLPTNSLVAKNGKVYLSLGRSENDSTGYGAVAVIDTATFSTEFIFNTGLYPEDIEADDAGNVYLTSGTHNASILASYDGKTGRLLSTVSNVPFWSYIFRNPKSGKLYTVNTYDSPTVLTAFETSGGVITGHYNSPSGGDLTPFVNRVSPDGSLIFNGSGRILTSSPTQDDDMKYAGSLGKPFTSICFDLAHNRIYTANSKAITSYRYNGKMELEKIILEDDVEDLQMDGTRIAAVLKKASGTCYISEFAPDTLLAGISTGGTPVPAFNPFLHEYNITVQSATPSINITATVFDLSGTVSGDVGTQPILFGVNTFRIRVTGAVSGISETYTLHITRQKVPVTGVSLDQRELNLIAGQSYQLTAAIHPDNASIKEITWSSSTSFATVNKGKVVGVTPGSAVVKVTTIDGSFVDSCNITVKFATITYNSQGGSAVKSGTASYDSAIAQPIPPTRQGYKFAGWYKESACKNKWSFTSDKVTGDMTLYAAWTPIAYTVSYNPNGGTGATAPSAHIYDMPRQLTANGFKRVGYSFVGWSAAPNGPKAYSDKQIVSNLSQTDKATVALYAAWKANTYNISFNPQGGTLISGGKTVVYDGTYGVLPIPTKAGYYFAGWYTQTIGRSTKITSSTTVKITTNTTLYAYWQFMAPYLSGINLSSGKLSPAFSQKVYNYKVALGESVSSITITPVLEYQGSTMTINGMAVSSLSLPVANGKTVKATVKVKLSGVVKTYTVSISRAKSTNADLASMTAPTGVLTPKFDAAVTSYTLKLNEYTSGVKITVKAASSLARAYPATVNVTLTNGRSKVIKIKVTAQSGATKTYVVTVVRAMSTDASLAFIKTNSTRNILTPAFNSGVTSYTITLPSSGSSATVSVKLVGYMADVAINGMKRTSYSVKLAHGLSQTLHVVVTAQAGNKMDYYIIVTRK